MLNLYKGVGLVICKGRIEYPGRELFGKFHILRPGCKFIGLKFEESQLRFYEKQTERNKIMGDPEVAKTPRKVSAGFMLKRMAEAEKFKKTFRLDCWATPEMRELESWGQRIKREKITTENILEQSFFPPKS